ncbi:MAG: hypothetical protein MUO76_04625, partial [Anaerolineaceae bacterium]|nr:hypothetical protein [Anaerolineaceae bacterium]
RMRRSGLLFSLLSGGALVFLGLMDWLFFLQNGLYLPFTAEIAIEGEGYSTELTNTSFVGWGPVDDPKFLVYIWLEKPTSSKWGSIVAAPIFSRVVNELIVLMNLPPDDIRLQLLEQ